MAKSAYQKHQEKIMNQDPNIRRWNNYMKKIAKQNQSFKMGKPAQTDWSEYKPQTLEDVEKHTASKWAKRIKPLPKF